ncbi:Aste57867_2374 [Aphanomyces stellatus]|uniref:Aste57867_2374 protein n=1 Tax=Aphanomyces stellatus TaxID=120398 RepID=A0A485K8V6_9STRA|nr:hypothetical protein As57867_002369 [Aphanomyces stellatus]VFT79575.1 Aste57867_2374 [Aphanomyces stellatus]
MVSCKRVRRPLLWHVHTMVAAKGNAFPKVKYNREALTLPDGGLVSLDWVAHPLNISYADNHPTIIILHGAGGSSKDTYVRITAAALSTKGWRVVALNTRGQGNTPLVTPRCGNGFSTLDIRGAVAYLRSTVVRSGPLIGIGFSLGANIMVKYAGEEEAACPLSAVVSISNPYDSINLDKMVNDKIWNRYVYAPAILEAAKKEFFKHPGNAQLFQDLPGFSATKVRTATTLRQIDDLLSRQIEGYNTLDEYFRDASCVKYMHNVRVPLLCISALDDPFCPPGIIPGKLCRQNPKIILVKTASGGHLGFLQGNGMTMWTSDVIAQYCAVMAGDDINFRAMLASPVSKL